MDRNQKIKTAEETLNILQKGFYYNKFKEKIEIKSQLDFSIKNSILYRPDDFRIIENNFQSSPQNKEKSTIEITTETTLSAIKRIIETTKQIPVCLNFASAKQPGGGFREGHVAQEESITLASGLYASISQMHEMYEYNKQLKSALYSDYMIYSPKVPIFRDDNDQLLPESHLVSVITAPAVNVGALLSHEQDKIASIMLERIRKILLLAIKHKYNIIILGAYGCGVFKNSAEDVARYFKTLLIDQNIAKYFQKIIFAIYETAPDKPKYTVFREILENAFIN